MNNLSWKTTRDGILVTLGGFMLAHETLVGTPDPMIIGAALALLGLPSTLRIDAKRREKNEE